jgi:hypothetical protein
MFAAEQEVVSLEEENVLVAMAKESLTKRRR